MCGLFGAVGSVVNTLREKDLRTARDSVKHRGPDDQGHWNHQDKPVFMAHRRLSIIDLSRRGRQPMFNENTGDGIVYNGEVYNYQSIRDDLISRGHDFRTETDTEVVLHAYREWGKDCLHRFRGMFAFAIWDNQRDQLFAARDRFGIKPFYYTQTKKGTIFASELSCFEELSTLDLQSDQTAAYDFFTYLYIPYPKTIYKQVSKLSPGHYLIAKGDDVRTKQYWDLDTSSTSGHTTEEAENKLRQLIKDSVGLRMVSDAPLGSFLSGGIDSSIVTLVASELSQSPLNTFTVRFENEEYSEHHYARDLVDRVQTNHHEKTVSVSDARDQLNEILKNYGEPFADTSALPTYLISKAASEHVKVILSGDGGDEVFGGYGWYPLYKSDERFYQYTKWFLPYFWSMLRPIYSPSWRGYSRLEEVTRGGPDRYAYIMRGMNRDDKRRFLDPQFLDMVPEGYDDLWFYRKFWRDDLSGITRLQYLDLKTYLPCDILTKVDRVSMLNSLEVRVPLLDHKLVEFVFHLSENNRLPGGQLKGLLKNTFASRLPNSILNREKKGFSIPWHEWMGDEFDNSKAPRRFHRAMYVARLFPEHFPATIGRS